MADSIVREWLDNPILVKHAQSRLRPRALASGVAVVLILCLCIAWAGIQSDLFRSGAAFGIYLCLQEVILVVMGGFQVGLAISQAKSSGILDFHRVSPVSSSALVLGFFLAAPIREYALFAVTLPFSLLCLAFGAPSFRGFVQLEIALLLIAWLVHGLALFISLLVRSYRGWIGVMGLAGVFFLFLGEPLLFATPRPSALVKMDVRLGFYGLSLPWLAVVLIAAAPILALLFLACRRKMESDLNHPLSKPQAVAALLAVGLVVEGFVWNTDYDWHFTHNFINYIDPKIFLLYLETLAGVVFLAMVSANRAEYLKGLRRAAEQGKKRLSVWHDLALNRIVVAAVCLVILGVATLAGSRRDDVSWGPFGNPAPYSPLATAAAVLTVGYSGLAFQFFLLQFGRRGAVYFTMFVFVFWIVPLLFGAVAAVLAALRYGPENASLLILNLSPIAGIAFLDDPPGLSSSLVTAAQACAITPPIFFLFLFGSLLTMAQRGANREFRLSRGDFPNDGRALVVPPSLDQAQA